MNGGRVGWGLGDRGLELGLGLGLGQDGVGDLVEGGMMGVFGVVVDAAVLDAAVLDAVVVDVVVLVAATYAPVPPLFHKSSAIV